MRERDRERERGGERKMEVREVETKRMTQKTFLQEVLREKHYLR